MKKSFMLSIAAYLNKEYNRQFESLLKKYHLTQIEVDVLAFLANNPEYKKAKDIVEIRNISKSHVSYSVDLLCKKGYISKIIDNSNRRCNLLSVNESAKPIIEEIQEIQKIFKEKMYQGISEEERKIVDKVFIKMKENIRGGKVNE